MSRYEIDPEESKVWIEGSSSVYPIRAHASGLRGWVEVVADEIDGEVRIDVSLLRSGNPLVDRETKRRISADQHPEIIGTVIGSRRHDEDTYDVHGEIAFKGHVGPVRGEVVASVGNDRVEVTGTERFDVRDWGLRLPRLGLLKVHPQVDVRIHLVAH
ncbi:MAG: YceI family protein [Actinomycetia bacterium]|nr:YceI family protein [Actinomycetes bacterium]